MEEIIKRLQEHQTRLGLTDTAFASDKLKVSKSAWSLLKRGQYSISEDNAVGQCLTVALTLLEDELANPGRNKNKWVRKTGEIARTSILRACLSGVRECVALADSGSQDRLFVFLAPTGGGKSTFLAALERDYKETFAGAECSRPWARYFVALKAVARAVGIKDDFYDPHRCEEAVLNRCREKIRVLAIDEAHHFSPDTFDLIKLILNQTPTAVVLTGTPDLFNAMEKKASPQWQQLRRRMRGKIVFKNLTAADVKLVMESRLKGDVTPFLKPMTEAANEFGYFNTISHVCSGALDLAQGQAVTLEMIEAKIDEERRRR